MSVSFKGRFDTPSRQVSSERIPRSRHPRWLRGVSLLTSATFVWSTVFALPARLWAEPKPVSPAPAAVALKDNRKPTHFPNRLPVPANSLVPLSDLEVLRQKRLTSAHPAPVRLTLLDETARLSRSVSPAEVAGWKHDLTSSSLTASDKAKRLVWLGEWELAHNENLDAAKAHFVEARRLTPASAEAHGVARFDTAILMMLSGHYADARTEFVSLISPKTPMTGYDRQSCALWSRHAAACEGYHNERSKAGIVEPGRLDPLCGAAGLAVYLKSHGMPFDQKRVLNAVRVTGRGSNLQDVLDGAKKLGLKAWAVGGDEKVMQRLPKPLVAFVEHDHFIAVTATDKTGVTYLCADCGDWPGGRQHLSWKQWRKMDASAYGVFAKSGTAEDRWLTTAEAQKKTQFGGRPDLTTRLATGDAVTNAMTFIVTPTNFLCGYGNGTNECPCTQNCPNDAGGSGGGGFSGSPSAGDPVNLATLQEVYRPAPDLTVYNPTGSSVSWSRMYQSLRGYDAQASIQNFGAGWSTPFDYFVYDAGTTNSSGVPNNVNIVEQNGARVALTISSVPTAANPTVACGVPNGYPVMVNWKYDSTTTKTYFEINFSKRSRIVTTSPYLQSPYPYGPKIYAIGKQYDRQGNSIQFNWTQATTGPYAIGLPQLNSIADSNGTALLTVNRSSGTTGTITSVSDRYNQSVYYTVSSYATTGVPAGYPQTTKGISHVSQIVATGTSSPPDRYAYGYSNVTNHEGETIPMLSSITVPSPTGTGTATATINYKPTDMTVSSLVDANSNTRTYSIVDANHTKVTITNSSGVTVGSYIAGFDNTMSATTMTDGKGNIVSSTSYASSSTPFGASSVQDGNQYAGTVSGSTTYTYDTYGQVLTVTSPRGVVTTYTYTADTNFPCGKLTKIQTVEASGNTLGATTYGYDSYGNVNSVTSPKPGVTYATNAMTDFVTTTYTYDALGNLTSITAPGNASASTITTTFGYTTDGTYSQTEALGQPLTVTNSLGKVTHLRYDVRCNTTSLTDALGNAVTMTYNLANQLLSEVFPATGQSGTGQSQFVSSYLYPGGIDLSETLYNESGTQVKQVSCNYGNEGELLSVTGSTEPVTYTYDGLYRKSSVTDGNSHTTSYYYKAAGYLDSVTYPGYTGTTPTYNSTNDAWNVSGADSLRYSSYDKNGNVLSRVDGRSISTTYAYNTPESLPTSVSYSDSTPSVTLAYDTFGRVNSVSSSSQSITVNSYDDGDAQFKSLNRFPLSLLANVTSCLPIPSMITVVEKHSVLLRVTSRILMMPSDAPLD